MCKKPVTAGIYLRFRKHRIQRPNWNVIPLCNGCNGRNGLLFEEPKFSVASLFYSESDSKFHNGFKIEWGKSHLAQATPLLKTG